MFGFVPQREYDAEHERRLRAEGEVDAARLQIAALNSFINELLDRSLPKPPAAVPGFGLPPGVRTGSVTATEILAMPAVGKRGIRERNAAARVADARDAEEASARDVQQRRATLTPEEQAILDKQIPR